RGVDLEHPFSTRVEDRQYDINSALVHYCTNQFSGSQRDLIRVRFATCQCPFNRTAELKPLNILLTACDAARYIGSRECGYQASRCQEYQHREYQHLCSDGTAG